MLARPSWSTKRAARRLSGAAGFTLLEILLVVGLIGTLAAVASVAFPSFASDAKADGEMQRVISLLRSAREAAIAQRRNVLVEFPTPAELRSVRQDVANGAVVGTTELARVGFEGDFQTILFPGLPDTDDHFGNGSAVSFDNAASILFTTEGALVDQTGDPVNGTVFIGRPDHPDTARAVTVLGTTGLIGGWRWSGTRWTR